VRGLRVVVRDGEQWLAFERPQEVLVCEEAPGLPELLARLDSAIAGGRCVAGYLAYEAAAGLGLPTKAVGAGGPPLAAFGVYAEPAPIEAPRAREAQGPEDWHPALALEDYSRAITRIQEHLAAGDTYQVNFSFPLTAPFAGDAWALFARLAAAQRGPCSAFVDLDHHAIVSVSPELFFVRDGRSIVTRPMKGTAARGLTQAEDDSAARALSASPKERAENVMIVDMLRNDLGRAAAIGSVVVPTLFEVERYPTLLQMVSSVAAESDASTGALLGALFPCASVTGAPKRRTMEIIAALEPRPRGVYTGTIGWAGPGPRAHFNVAIRTAVVDRQCRCATYGVGSGVVADSVAEAEYAECLLKARVLTEPPFSLPEARMVD
jgi:para-aminobenzoate synthetase/4-amino-4-deoxychorismate lyase